MLPMQYDTSSRKDILRRGVAGNLTCTLYIRCTYNTIHAYARVNVKELLINK